MDKDKKKQPKVLNSTVEFLVFTMQENTQSLNVIIKNETIWLTQKLIAQLFDCSLDNISLHLKNIYNENELTENSTSEEFSIVQEEGNRTVKRKTKLYNLDAIISVGYRVNSHKATQFRQWATNILKEFAIKGFALDNERLKNGAIFNKDYFEDLLEQIREIRNSERRFYQKITDIYATAMDYNANDQISKTFFATVQNKLHYSIHGNTAPELIIKRADSQKPYMGLTNWKHSPTGKILPSDVSVAKNYLSKEELEALNRIASMYLDYAEDQAKRKIPMTMADWSKKLDAFLQFNEKELLSNAGTVSKEIAKTFAESEFSKYRIIQDKVFNSDFDKEIENIKRLEQKRQDEED